MLKTYEALCEDDRLTWLAERPDGRRLRVLVTVLDDTNGTSDRPSRAEIRRILDETRGAWGNKTMDEIDEEVREMRKEWDRPWYPEDDPHHAPSDEE